VVAEGLELAMDPPDSHPSWRPPAMRVSISKYSEPLCGSSFSQVTLNRRGRSYYGAIKWGDAISAFAQVRRLNGHTP
jgi:hypothetical protein